MPAQKNSKKKNGNGAILDFEAQLWAAAVNCAAHGLGGGWEGSIAMNFILHAGDFGCMLAKQPCNQAFIHQIH